MTTGFPSMASARRNVAVLATNQALLFANNATAIAINGLAGYALASNKAWATFPVTGYVIGGALLTFPASLLMKRVGRRAGFSVGILVGMIGVAVCAGAVVLGDFWMLCLGTLILGAYNGFAQYYRFAAAEAAPSDFKSRAISLVLAGGLVGGIIGPETSKLTVDLLATKYLGAYLSLMLFLVIALAVVQMLRIAPPTEAEHREPVRPLGEIVSQPAFVVAAVSAALGYGIMNLLMTATPLAMGICGHPYASAAFVIEWHVIGMFAPSFFTGWLIKRFGLIQVMLAGAALLLVCVGIALAGISVANFWLALLLLGVGWNFLFIGGTTLLTEAYRPSERAKAQGVNDLAIFLVMATSSSVSGVLLERNGWGTLNLLAIPFIVAVVLCLLWLMALRRRAITA